MDDNHLNNEYKDVSTRTAGYDVTTGYDITADTPRCISNVISACVSQLSYSGEEYFENILQNLEYAQKKRLRKLRVKVNKEE